MNNEQSIVIQSHSSVSEVDTTERIVRNVRILSLRKILSVIMRLKLGYDISLDSLIHSTEKPVQKLLASSLLWISHVSLKIEDWSGDLWKAAR